MATPRRHGSSAGGPRASTVRPGREASQSPVRARPGGRNGPSTDVRFNEGMFRNGLNPMDLIALVVALAVVVGLIAGVTLLVRAVWRSGSKRQNP